MPARQPASAAPDTDPVIGMGKAKHGHCVCPAGERAEEAQAHPTKAAFGKDPIRPLPGLAPGHAGARNTGRRVPPAGTGAGARATDAARRSGPP
ncbi:transcription elongation factor SPT6 [Rhodovulum sulfidophilum]|uniref:Transcription elongation factor SPT6 n=1 Tax=Rhodovulum sulfidophilum TaxID=35806 RepID=A0A0D6AXC3_RHOSU|nr:transcription elongation factor SPT6 [Rhodovulum sulfidophilum]